MVASHQWENPEEILRESRGNYEEITRKSRGESGIVSKVRRPHGAATLTGLVKHEPLII
jgi:hypothetical protein